MLFMFDYKLLEALALVVKEDGFDKAANKLFITQSAVSQRIKTLEEQMGQILITRKSPIKATAKGKELIKHYHQVLKLEDDLSQNENKTVISIGLNEDSLATWFLKAIRSFLESGNSLIDLIVDDQEKTSQLLKDGIVSGCISSSPVKIQGCSVRYLGKMEYSMVCTPDFYQRWFKSGFSRESIENAPAVIYNQQDSLHDQYLKQIFHRNVTAYPIHYIPSTEQFLAMIEMNQAYGVVPLIQCGKLIEEKRLIVLHDGNLDVELYWHHWNINTMMLASLTEVLLEQCKDYLN